MPYVKKKMNELIPAEYNARKMAKSNKIGLGESIERFGLVQPIVWNKRTGNIVGGHKRHEFLKENGVTETTVYAVDLTEEEEMALNLELNNPEIQGEWTEKIDALLEQIKPDGNLFQMLRFDALEKRLDKEAGINTQCPCCNYKWNLKKAQARIATEAEIDELNEVHSEVIPPPTKQEQLDVQKIAEELSKVELDGE